jgi:hypothetical protein
MPEIDDEFDDFDDDDDEPDESGEAECPWPTYRYPPPPRRNGAGRGWLLALVAVVAAALAFGTVKLADHDLSGSPAASSTPASSTPGANGSGGEPSNGPGGGTQLPPQDGGASPLPSGAIMQLEIGGLVTAVSTTSITIGSGGRAVTAAVTSATEITGKVTSIGGIKVGDLVSALVSGTSGHLVASSIQDPASLPSGLGQ